MDYPITEQKCGRIRTLFDDETYHRTGRSELCRLLNVKGNYQARLCG